MPDFRAAWKALFSRGRVPPPAAPLYATGWYGLTGRRINSLPPGAKLDYAREVGDKWRNVAVAACLRWIKDNAGQAKLRAVNEAESEGDEAIEGDPTVALLNEPNPHWTADQLIGAFHMSDQVDGNSYFLRAEGAGGDGPTDQLWWVPWWMMGPYTDAGSKDFIDGYWYRPGDGKTYLMPPDRIIHIRNGVDPYDPRYGCSALAAAGDRSIVGVNRAETYTCGILANGGPLRVFIPDATGVIYDEATAGAIKRKAHRETNLDNAGDLLVLTEPGRIEQASSGPQELALDSLPDRLEANICALMGMNGMVVGLNVGDQTRTFNNMETAEQHAWKNALLPANKRFATAFTQAYRDGRVGWCLEWDYSEVKALSENMAELVTLATTAAGGPVCTVDEARSKWLGLPPMTPEQKAEIIPPPPPALDPNADPNADPNTPDPNTPPDEGNLPDE